MSRACAAARGGSANVAAGPLGLLDFDLSFMGTGTAVLERDDDLRAMTVDEELSMDWLDNVFVGHHWLLGRFKIELDKSRNSRGRVRALAMEGERAVGINTNEFYFKFSFPRLNGMTFRNERPIVNTARIFDIPPTEESVFELAEESKDVGAFLGRSENRTGLGFKYCKITVYPKRNIGVEVLSSNRGADNTYSLQVRYTNTSPQRAKCAYFLVLHDDDLLTKDDYGFEWADAGASFTRTFQVGHRRSGMAVEIPICGGLYQPVELRGSAETTVTLQF